MIESKLRDSIVNEKPVISLDKLVVLKDINSRKNLFITGNAGTGKSFLLNIIKEQYQNKLQVTASTGIAAVHINGTTIHSWSGIGLGTLSVTEICNFINSGKGTQARRRIQRTKILAIDEISMISAQVFDLLNQVFKVIRGNEEPFGGIQIILFGDFFQLPPVDKNSSDKQFCFESTSWHEANIKTHILTETFRQRDPLFLDLLNNLRMGQLNNEHMKMLELCASKSVNNDIKPTIIATHNWQVDKINESELTKLPGEEIVYYQNCEGNERQIQFLKKNCLAPEKLRLKAGAQVMMLKNSRQKDGIYNGSIGVIIRFSSKGLPMVRFANNKIVEIECDEWVIEELNLDTYKKVVKAKLVQIPLTLAWAITVHKSQGMTLDAIECDLGKAFEDGQIYVALSRAKSLDNVYLKNFNQNLIKVNQKVVEFYKSLLIS